MLNMWKSAIMGVVVGDALGCPVEMMNRSQLAMNPVGGMRGFGTYSLPAGTWTDDTSMTIATVESIKRHGVIDLDDIMGNFCRWLQDGSFTPYGFTFGVGRGTREAIQRYIDGADVTQCGSRNEEDNGNGSLMRIMPVVLWCLDMELPERVAISTIDRVGALTHAHLRSRIACGLYYFLAKAIVDHPGRLIDVLQRGIDDGVAFYTACLDDKSELYQYRRLFDVKSFAALPVTAIKSSGYVVETLEAAVWCLACSHRLSAALLAAVNLGGDTDTVAAVAGGLAGLYYGYGAIHRPWLEVIVCRDKIEGMLHVLDQAGSIA